MKNEQYLLAQTPNFYTGKCLLVYIFARENRLVIEKIVSLLTALSVSCCTKKEVNRTLGRLFREYVFVKFGYYTGRNTLPDTERFMQLR